MSVNKGLLEHSHAHSLIWFLSQATGMNMNSYQRDCMTHKTSILGKFLKTFSKHSVCKHRQLIHNFVLFVLLSLMFLSKLGIFAWHHFIATIFFVEYRFHITSFMLQTVIMNQFVSFNFVMRGMVGSPKAVFKAYSWLYAKKLVLVVFWRLSGSRDKIWLHGKQATYPLY